MSNHYWINAPDTELDGEDVLGFKSDAAVLKRDRVHLPVLRTPTGRARQLNKSLPMVDALILPRDYDTKAEPRLKVLKERGAADVPMPPGARTSFMSINRHVVTTQWNANKGASAIREQVEAELKKRKLVVYVDRDADEPLRVAIVPPFTDGEIVGMFRKAGYTPRDPKNANRPSVGSLGLLTETSKMGCYSFNLPAGPPKLHGTCPSSTVGFMYSTMGEVIKAQKGKRDPAVVIDPETFICNGCYAIKNAYGNPSTIVQMQVRYHITRAFMKNEGKAVSKRTSPANIRLVSAENYKAAKPKKASSVQSVIPLLPASALQPVNLSFSELLVVAISEARDRVTQRRKKLETFGYTAAEYERTERIANWTAARTKVASLVKQLEKEENAKKRARLQDELAAQEKRAGATISELTKAKATYKKTYADWQLPDPGYFRIHDAGDMYSDPYFRAWLNVCKGFSNEIRFWAPTRMWAFAGGLRDQSLKLIPENLALRPSTLHFREKAPTPNYLHTQLGLAAFKRRKGGGLSGPSGSAPEKPTAKDYKCPAYEHWSAGGGAIRLDPRSQKAVGGTCITARGPKGENGCRVCWNGKGGEYHDRVVFYEEH